MPDDRLNLHRTPEGASLRYPQAPTFTDQLPMNEQIERLWIERQRMWKRLLEEQPYLKDLMRRRSRPFYAGQQPSTRDLLLSMFSRGAPRDTGPLSFEEMLRQALGIV